MSLNGHRSPFYGPFFGTYFTPSEHRKGCRNANMKVIFSDGGFKKWEKSGYGRKPSVSRDPLQT